MKAQVRTTAPEPGPCCFTVDIASRAINVQLAGGDQRPGRPVAVIVVLVAFGLDVRVDPICDPLVSAARLVLVDQRGPFAVVPYSRHQVLKSRAAVRRELVTRMPQIVNMQASGSDRFHRMRPARHLVEVTAPQRHSLLASENERTRLVRDES